MHQNIFFGIRTRRSEKPPLENKVPVPRVIVSTVAEITVYYIPLEPAKVPCPGEGLAVHVIACRVAEHLSSGLHTAGGPSHNKVSETFSPTVPRLVCICFRIYLHSHHYICPLTCTPVFRMSLFLVLHTTHADIQRAISSMLHFVGWPHPLSSLAHPTARQAHPGVGRRGCNAKRQHSSGLSPPPSIALMSLINDTNVASK